MSVINLNDYSKFIVTGRYYNSTTRFRSVYGNYYHANAVNLWRGSVWAVHKLTGKRRLIKRVWN